MHIYIYINIYVYIYIHIYARCIPQNDPYFLLSNFLTYLHILSLQTMKIRLKKSVFRPSILRPDPLLSSYAARLELSMFI